LQSAQGWGTLIRGEVSKNQRVGHPPLVPVSPSRGSTGRTTPRDLKEQLAMEQVKANPGAGKKLPLQMNDPRWPASDGWVKMSQNVNGVEVHYVENTTTGQVDDFKFK
jgi:filamentous hemagglutinin